MCDLLVDTDTKGLIDNCSEKAIAEIYAEVIPEGPIDYDLLQKWKRSTLLQRVFSRFTRQIGEREIANELFESYKVTPYVQKVREFIKSPLHDECLLSQQVWTLTFRASL